MIFSKTCLALTISTCLLNLTACGGGSGSSSEKNETGASNNSSNTNQNSSIANSSDFDAITGVYDASITSNNIKDESYLYISGNGKVTAYNYLGDSKDAGNNCYREATGTEINSGLTGKTLIYSNTNSEYTTTVNNNTVAWQLDANKSITKITYAGTISGSKISLTVSGASLIVDSKKITAPTIIDITSSLCK